MSTDTQALRMLAWIALRGKDRRSTWRCHRAYVASEADAGRSAVIATMAANAVIAIAERARSYRLPDWPAAPVRQRTEG